MNMFAEDTRIRVGQMTLHVLEQPEYAVAHPDEMHFHAHQGFEPCEKCLLAIRPDTGELVLLWGAYGGTHYSLSRETPDFHRHSEAIYGHRRYAQDAHELPLLLATPRELVA